jgi:hypothetical protein
MHAHYVHAYKNNNMFDASFETQTLAQLLPYTTHLTPPLQKQADDLIVDAAVVLVREKGLMDAKALVASDVEVLLEAADKALVRCWLSLAHAPCLACVDAPCTALRMHEKHPPPRPHA